MPSVSPFQKWTLAVVLLAALAGCSRATPAPEEPPVPVRAQPVAFQDEARRLSYAGTVAPRRETTVAFRVGGKIVDRPIEVGSRVEPGGVLARLDPEDLHLSAQAARAQLAGAEADVAQTRANLERYQRLNGSEVFTRAIYDQRLAASTMAEARLNQARNQVRLAENQLAYATVTADAAGVVTAVMAEAGQVVAPGQGVLKLARTDELEVVVAIPEHRLPELNQTAGGTTVSLWAEPDRRYPARLREVSPGADPVTRTYTAKFTLIAPPASVQLGMSATLHLEWGGARPVAALPLTALFQSGTTPALWEVDPAEGTLALRPVTVAGYRQDAVLIAEGVSEGALVVTAGVHKLDAGRRVRLAGAPRP